MMVCLVLMLAPTSSALAQKKTQNIYTCKLVREARSKTPTMHASTSQTQKSDFKNNVAQRKRTRDQKLNDEAYVVPKDSIAISERAYRRGMGTKPLLYSIERRKKDTKVTFLQPIYYSSQWLHYSQGFKIVDQKSGDEYHVRGYDGGASFGKLMIVKGCNSKYVYVSLLFPKLKKRVRKIDILELPHKTDALPSNDDGIPKSYFNIKVEDYLVTSQKNKKIYY